jgi:hypothetical protein
MKPIKMLGLAALTALLAMAFVGASSATADPTALCKADESPCEAANEITHVHETTLSGGKATLLNSISNVLCDTLFLGDVNSTAVVEGVLLEGKFTYTNCVDEKPNGCTATEENGPAEIVVLKEGHETASIEGEGEVKVVCTGISCKYNGEGLIGTGKGPLLAVTEKTNGEVSISEQTTNKVSGLLCPATAKLDITTTPLEATYISAARAALDYCVEYEHTNGYYLGVNNRVCINRDATRLGNYALVRGPAGVAANTMVCVRLLQFKGLWKKPGNGTKCEEDEVNNQRHWELAVVQ